MTTSDYTKGFIDGVKTATRTHNDALQKMVDQYIEIVEQVENKMIEVFKNLEKDNADRTQ